MKQPNYLEKLSCGLYMEECKFKVYDEKDFSPEAADFLNEFKLAGYDSNHLLDIREVSHVSARTCLLSGMKPHLTGMIPNKYS
jgi:hypothetical protein